jgi:type II secretory pathway pseudopilin PulG
MGQQQLLLIILGVIIVGIAIAVGLQLFQSGSLGANQDAIVNDVMNIAAHADQYRIRPVTMGGGGGKFTGYALPKRLEETGNGKYSANPGEDDITITGESLIFTSAEKVILVYDPTQENDADRYTWTFEGQFGAVSGGGEGG